MAGIVKILREFSGSGPYEANDLISGAVVANVPQNVAGIGAVIPRTTNATAGNTGTSYLLSCQAEVHLDTGISATIGQNVYYNTGTELFTTTKPAAGFFFGRALSASTAAGGYCKVQQITTTGGAVYVDGLAIPKAAIVASGSTTTITGSGVTETIVVAGVVSTDKAQVWPSVAGSTQGWVKRSKIIVDGSITVTLSSASGSGATFDYQVTRATA